MFLPGDPGRWSRTLCECQEWEGRQNPPCPQDMAVLVGVSRHTVDHSELRQYDLTVCQGRPGWPLCAGDIIRKSGQKGARPEDRCRQSQG